MCERATDVPSSRKGIRRERTGAGLIKGTYGDTFGKKMQIGVGKVECGEISLRDYSIETGEARAGGVLQSLCAGR